MTRIFSTVVPVVAGASLLVGSVALAQEAPPAGAPPGRNAVARGQGRQGGRAGLPPPGPNMNQQQVQAWLDAYALVQAERELQLTAEQYPEFVSRLTRLQGVRRRYLQERLRLLRELGALVQSSGTEGDDVVQERLKTLDELGRRSADELRQAYEALDTSLTTKQRARFRLFEEQLERRKVELLARIGQGGPGIKAP
jgi:hypothetical protein